MGPTQHSYSPHTNDYYWSTNLRQQIQHSWSTRIRDRPSATALKNFFTAEIALHKEPLRMSNNNKILVSSMKTPASNKSLHVSSSTRRHHHHHHYHRRHSSRE